MTIKIFINGFIRNKDVSWKKLIDISQSDAYIDTSFFGLVGTYSNQACHIIILRVTKYAHGDVGVAIDKITNYSNDSKYGVTIKYKITENNVRVWIRGYFNLVVNNLQTTQNTEIVQEYPDEDAIDLPI